MVALPILARLAYNFLTRSETDIHQDFAVSAYLFLCAIFVAMTNQVYKTRGFVQCVYTACVLNDFYICAVFCIDSQMVAHLLGSAQVGHVPAKSSHHTAASTSSHSPCGATRNVLLHHDRLA